MRGEPCVADKNVRNRKTLNPDGRTFGRPFLLQTFGATTTRSWGCTTARGNRFATHEANVPQGLWKYDSPILCQHFARLMWKSIFDKPTIDAAFNGIATR
jgi:hypothetical protein